MAYFAEKKIFIGRQPTSPIALWYYEIVLGRRRVVICNIKLELQG